MNRPVKLLAPIFIVCAVTTGCGGGSSNATATAATANGGGVGSAATDSGSVSVDTDDASGGGATHTVTYTVRARADADIALVAYQNGDGPWTRIAPAETTAIPLLGVVQHTYRIPVSADGGRFGAVVVCDREGTPFRGDLVQAVAPRFSARYVSCVDGDRYLTGTATNYDGNTEAWAYLGNQSGATPLGRADYQILAPDPDFHTLVGAARVPGDPSGQYHYLVLRDRYIGWDTRTLPPLDFAEALPPDPTTYTTRVVGRPSTFFTLGDQSVRLGRTYVPLPQGGEAAPGDGEARTFRVLNAAQRQPEDRYRLGFATYHHGQEDWRGGLLYTTQPGNHSFQFPGGLARPTMAMDGNRLRIGFTPYSAGVDGVQTQSYHFHLMDRVAGHVSTWNFHLDQAWLAGATAYTFPNLSGLAGWNDRYYPIARLYPSYQWGPDYISRLTALATPPGVNVWDVIEGFNGGTRPTATGLVYWGRHNGQFAAE